MSVNTDFASTAGSPAVPQDAAAVTAVRLAPDIAEIRQQLEQFAASMPTVMLDPRAVGPAPWAYRHPCSLRGPAFESLKDSIARLRGNVVPILVRRTAANSYEIVYGRRRRQACEELGLPVKSVIWDGALDEIDQFLLADSENRLRKDPSAYEQGMSYLAALAAGIFPSRRALADASGVSHTWVNKAICVAELPAVVLDCCVSPTQVQPRHAQMITAALSKDSTGLLERAARLKADGVRLASSKLADALTGRVAQPKLSGDLAWRGERLGDWTLKQGTLLLTVGLGRLKEEDAARVAEAVARALKARTARQSRRRQPETDSLQLRLDA